MKRDNIAVSMIVKNEEGIVEECIHSFFNYGLRPHFYILDTGSTDRTMDNIRNILDDYQVAFGTQFSIVKDEMLANQDFSFAAARNSCLNMIPKHFDYDWIISIDADERMNLETARKLEDFFSDNSNYDNYDVVYFIKGDSCRPRMFKPNFRYEYPVHEEIDLKNISRDRICNLEGAFFTDNIVNSPEQSAFDGTFYSAIAENWVKKCLLEKDVSPKEKFQAYFIAASQLYYSYKNTLNFKRDYQKLIKRYYDNAFNIAYENPNEVSYPSWQKCLSNYYEFINQNWKDIYKLEKEKDDDLLLKAHELNTIKGIHPIACYIIIEYYEKYGPDKLFYNWSNIYLYNSWDYFDPEEVYGVQFKSMRYQVLQWSLLKFWNINKKKSLEIYLELLKIDPLNELVVNNINWFNNNKNYLK